MLLTMVTLGALGGDGDCAQSEWEQAGWDARALTWIVDGRWFYTVWDASARWEAVGGTVWETAQAQGWREALGACGYAIPWPPGGVLELPILKHAPGCPVWVPGQCSCPTPGPAPGR